MNVIHFGSGNIGRGFVAPILKANKVIDNITFLDVNKEVIDLINNEKKYNVIEVDKKDTTITIIGINGFFSDDFLTEKNIAYVNTVGLITISIGQANLKFILKHLTWIIENRQAKDPLVIICCENGNRVSSFLKLLMNEQNHHSFDNVYFVDAVVDRIVPNIKSNSLLDVTVEKYFSWIVDNKQWPTSVEKLNLIEYSDNLDAEINKKICLLNGVHAAISWHRYSVDKLKTATLQEAIKDKNTIEFINGLMNEMVDVLIVRFGFAKNYLQTYVKQIIQRFENPKIIDELKRIGRNPISKLQKNERILAPLLFAYHNNLEYKHLLVTFNNALNYRVDDDQQSIKLNDLWSSVKQEFITKSINNLSDDEILFLAK